MFALDGFHGLTGCDVRAEISVEQHDSLSRPFARWEAAVATADRVAMAYMSTRRTSIHPARPQRFPKTKKRRSRRRRSSTICFEDVQARFLKKHGGLLSSALKSVFQEPIQFEAAPLSEDVKS